MKKLIKLFSLIGVLTLCIGMTLLTTNKINVNAQVVDLDYNERFWLPIGLFYDNSDNWYFTLNEQDWTETYREVVSPQLGYYTDRGLGSEFISLFTVLGSYNAEILETTPSVQTQQSIFNFLGIQPLYTIDIGFKILPLTNIEVNLYSNNSFNTSTVTMEKLATTTSYTVAKTPFNHVDQLRYMILKQYDLWVLDNPDYSNVYEMGKREGFDEGIEEGKTIGFDEGIEEGKTIGFDEGFEEGLESDTADAFNNGYNKGISDTFFTGFANWITPVIAIVIFGGGLFMFFTKKRNDRYHE